MSAPLVAQEHPPYEFAKDYTPQQLMSSPAASGRFVEQFCDGEAKFFGMARHPESGLAYDGWDLDPATGEPLKARMFSAASKECLDLALLTKALEGDPLIARVVSPSDHDHALLEAERLLRLKIRSYQRYLDGYPGFAGYMPWFNSGEKASPMGGWAKAFPTLDLGEMLWALKLTEHELRKVGKSPELTDEYHAFNERLAKRAREAMFNSDKVGVRGRVDVSDPLSPDSVFSGDALTTGEHGVHEGQMIVLYMNLYGGLTAEESAQVWKGTRMKRVEHKYGTTWQGFWGSPHEEWAYLFLPYRDLPEYRQLFRIREKIRSHNAYDHGYPGFGASAHDPSGKGYISASGIEGVGSQPVERQDVYTPYGAFPMLLQFSGRYTENVGLAWLHNMLLGYRMQGPFGAAESGDNAGTMVPPVKTIDASFTTLLALSGGLDQECAEMLKEDGKYEQFISIVKGEYDEAFGDAPLRESVDFAYPRGPAGSICNKN